MDKIPYNTVSMASGSKDKMLKLWIKTCTASSDKVVHATSNK